MPATYPSKRTVGKVKKFRNYLHLIPSNFFKKIKTFCSVLISHKGKNFLRD